MSARSHRELAGAYRSHRFAMGQTILDRNDPSRLFILLGKRISYDYNHPALSGFPDQFLADRFCRSLRSDQDLDALRTIEIIECPAAFLRGRRDSRKT